MRSATRSMMLARRILILLIVLKHVACFVVQSAKQTTLLSRTIIAATVVNVELQPEPEGGQDIAPRKSMDGCRVKQLQKIESKNGGDNVFQFWMTGLAQGELVNEIRTQILKDASKKANFPGFRKGQVPPYAQPQITQFAVQEGILKTIEGAVEAYGLQSLSGSEGEVQVHEDVKEIAKAYKTGNSIAFTATFNAQYESSESPLGAEETAEVQETN